ncbi:MAG: PHP domain-containing protein [Armatimonadetes bacterium]|nr:PHP domain-containing protein [Armatimonadota bacterium]
MIKWSRVRLAFSILTCEGLFATLRERLQWAPRRWRGEPSAGPSAARPPAMPRYHDYAGALHVHSTYSDGMGTVADIAEAANAAGLDYVILCDHSSLDARRNGENGWRGRTLVLVGTEVTTDSGHLLALDVPLSFLPAPDHAPDTQRAIQESGGFGFIALPCDLKDHWRDFGLRREGVGLEVFNLSSIARAKISLPGFMLVWLRYKGDRPQRAFHWVSARPARELRLWDQLTAAPAPDGGPTRVAGIGSLDAHGVMKVAGRAYALPTYDELFRTLRTHVVTGRPFCGDAGADQALVHGALAAGHCYIAYDNYGDSTGFVFEAAPGDAGGTPALMGDSVALPAASGAPARRAVGLTASAPRTRSLLRLYRNGRLVAAARGGRLDYRATEPGAYRVEVYLYRHRLGRLCLGAKPWIFSNPIYLHPVAVASPEPAARRGVASSSSE